MQDALFAPSGFSLAEYDRRWDAVLSELQSFDVDAACVTARINIEYLTGHDARGADMASFVVIVAPGRPRTLIARGMERVSIARESIPLDIVTFFSGSEDAIPAWVDTLTRLGLAQARLGLELDNWGLTPKDVERLTAALPGLRIVDTTNLVIDVADVKSPEELGVMRRAMRSTEAGFNAFYAGLQEGVTELALERDVLRAMADAGDVPVPAETNTLFGVRSALPHGVAVANPLRRNDVATLESSAYRFGYTAALGRTAILGRNDRAAALHDAADQAVAAGIDMLRPGVTAGEVDDAVRSVVERAGYGAGYRHRAGYALGLRWNQRSSVSLRPGSTRLIKRDMALHVVVFVYAEDDSFGVVTSDTVIVTQTGCEIMSSLPRTLRLL